MSLDYQRIRSLNIRFAYVTLFMILTQYVKGRYIIHSQKSAADDVVFLAYGDNDGDELYLTNLAEFLSQQYGAPVDRSIN